MISKELRAQIRQLYFAEHWKVGTISSQLGVHHDAVEKALEPRPVTHREGMVKSLLDDYKGVIDDTLKQYPNLRATRLFEMIHDRGYAGGIAILRRYVRVVRPASHHEAFFRLTTLPGEQAQVDWGSFGRLRIGRAERKISCFVMVLSWSRATFARFTLDQTLESFLRCHVEALERFGGAPRAVLYDNLKSVVLERDGDRIRFHPKILEFAGHYHFAPKPVARARGNEKGRVERRIRDLRESFFAARPFYSLEDLNRQVDAWILRVAHARRVPGGDEHTVAQALELERPRLLGLPEHPFSTDRVMPIASGKTPYVRFDLNDYTIPHIWVRKPLTLVASDAEVRVLNGQKEVACHKRSWDRGAQIECEAHLAALGAEKHKAHEHRGRNRLTVTCPHAASFLSAVALHGGFLGGTTSRLLRLLDQYGQVELDIALAEAEKRGAFAAHSVAHILDQRRRQRGAPVPLEVVLPDHPKVRSMTLTPHSLTTYDQLTSISNCAAKPQT